MRTGSVGNRSAEDMIRTLVEPKKTILGELRQKLLSLGYNEEVEYDAINIEPVLIYSKSDRKALFVRHKWELVAQIPLQSQDDRKRVLESFHEMPLGNFETTDEQGNHWLKFSLPRDEDVVLQVIEKA